MIVFAGRKLHIVHLLARNHANEYENEKSERAVTTTTTTTMTRSRKEENVRAARDDDKQVEMHIGRKFVLP